LNVAHAPVSAPPSEPERGRIAPASRTGESTYGQILKSSALIGGSSALTILAGIVRSKAVASLIGPAGFGFMAVYMSIVQLAQSVAGMGINASGVRQIAAAVGTGDTERIARTAAVLRRTSVTLGVLGAVLLALLSGPVSRLTFGDSQHTLPIALLSLTVLFGAVSGGQGALIQGLRRIKDLARMNVLGGVAGSAATIALVYLLRERGVAVALVATAGASVAFSWWYSRKLRFAAPPLSAAEIGHEAGDLLKLGFAFMASGMVMAGAAYVVRILIVRLAGLEAAGLYQAAWAVGGLYVGFILQAMGADFYPRLTVAIRDREQCNRIVNEQVLVSLLLAGPGVIATLVLAPLVLTALYSPEFRHALEVLRWICLGATLQVVTWPLGFVVVAEGRRSLFLWVEVAYAAVYLFLAWALVRWVGAVGAGMAFFGSYVFHAVVLYPIVRSLTGFRWSGPNLRLGGAFLALVGLVFCGFQVLPPWLAVTAGAVAGTASAAYSAAALVRLVPVDRLPRPFRLVMGWARVVPRRTP
jgi:PST family polysaccharide transporter